MQFNLELSVTEKCNLACPYCYVANQDTFLTPEIFDNSWDEFKTLVRRSHSHNEDYHVGFFGGEPLLNMDLIKYVVENYFGPDPHCQHMTIISNLSLITQEIVDYVTEYGIGMSWSFDGISSNLSRPLISSMKENDGFESVLDMYNSKRHLIKKVLGDHRWCKVMIFPGNVDTMTENLEFLVDLGMNCPDFMPVRDDIWSVDDLHNFRKECHRLADRTIQYFEDGQIVAVGMFYLAIRDTLIGLTKSKRPWGCFAGTHGAIMSVEGKFFPCARFASKKLLPMVGEEYNFDYWNKTLNPQNYDKCKSCRLYKICNAGCSYSQIRNNNEPVDSVCEINHIYYDETLRINRACKDMPAYKEYVQNIFTGQFRAFKAETEFSDIYSLIKKHKVGMEAIEKERLVA